MKILKILNTVDCSQILKFSCLNLAMSKIEIKVTAHVRHVTKNFIQFLSYKNSTSVSKTLSIMIDEYKKNNPHLVREFEKR